MAFDSNLIGDIDQGSVETTDIRYPLIRYCYGNSKLAAKVGGAEGHGGFFLSDDNMPADTADALSTALEESGWVRDSITLANNETLDGWYKREVSIAVVNMRKRWKATEAGRTIYAKFDWKSYQTLVEQYGRLVSNLQVFAIVKGLEPFAPFILTFSGSSAMAFEGSRKSAGALTNFSRTVIAAANAQTKGRGRWPYRGFWLTVGASRDKNGKPVFTEVGKGTAKTHLCLPSAIGLPDDPKQVDLDLFALDRPTFLQAQDLFTDSAAWKAAWEHIGEEEESGPGTGNGAPHGGTGNGAAPVDYEEELEESMVGIGM